MIANPNDGNSPRVEVATPTIDVSAGGLITATTEQEKGYVPGGTKSATQQLTTQGAKTVTPGTSEQVAVASGTYTTGDVKVAGDANLIPENIAEGVTIFGVTGTFAGGGGNIEVYTGTSVGELNKFYYNHTLTLQISADKTIIGCFYIPGDTYSTGYFCLSIPDGLYVKSPSDGSYGFNSMTRNSDFAVITSFGPETYQYYFVAFAQ